MTARRRPFGHWEWLGGWIIIVAVLAVGVVALTNSLTPPNALGILASALMIVVAIGGAVDLRRRRPGS